MQYIKNILANCFGLSYETVQSPMSCWNEDENGDFCRYIYLFLINFNSSMHETKKTFRSDHLTSFHKLLRNSRTVNLPSDEDQRDATDKSQQEDLEQLKLKIVER